MSCDSIAILRPQKVPLELAVSVGCYDHRTNCLEQVLVNVTDTMLPGGAYVVSVLTSGQMVVSRLANFKCSDLEGPNVAKARESRVACGSSRKQSR